MGRTTTTLLAAGLLALAACGSTTNEPSTGAPAADPGSNAGTTEAAPTATDAPAESTAPTPATDEPDSTTAPAATTDADETTDTSDSTPPPATDAPAAAARPDDGCSADNSPGGTDVAEGPLPALEVRAESAASPLPDLAVRRVNCAGGWVNLKNELPASQPLLVWFWAPH